MASRERTKGRKASGSYVQLPHAVLEHRNFTRLSPKGVKLLIDLYAAYRGHNNGNLCAAYSLMRKRGWKSKETLSLALDELQHYGLIVMTRQGGRDKNPNLYAVTWLKIDECNVVRYSGATIVAPGTWKDERPDWEPPEWYIRKRKKSTYPTCGSVMTA